MFLDGTMNQQKQVCNRCPWCRCLLVVGIIRSAGRRFLAKAWPYVQAGLVLNGILWITYGLFLLVECIGRLVFA